MSSFNSWTFSKPSNSLMLRILKTKVLPQSTKLTSLIYKNTETIEYGWSAINEPIISSTGFIGLFYLGKRVKSVKYSFLVVFSDTILFKCDLIYFRGALFGIVYSIPNSVSELIWANKYSPWNQKLQGIHTFKRIQWYRFIPRYLIQLCYSCPIVKFTMCRIDWSSWIRSDNTTSTNFGHPDSGFLKILVWDNLNFISITKVY